MDDIQQFDTLTHLENDTDQYLTFFLGEEEYGIDILQVQEIKGWGDITKIPNTPNYILGVINLRGSVVPIMDLRIRFGLEQVEYTLTTVIIVAKITMNDHARTVGIVVDAVSEVYNLTQENLQPPPEFGCSIDIAFIFGLANIKNKMVILMDINHLISEELLTDTSNQAPDQEQDSPNPSTEKSLLHDS